MINPFDRTFRYPSRSKNWSTNSNFSTKSYQYTLRQNWNFNRISTIDYINTQDRINTSLMRSPFHPLGQVSIDNITYSKEKNKILTNPFYRKHLYIQDKDKININSFTTRTDQSFLKETQNRSEMFQDILLDESDNIDAPIPKMIKYAGKQFYLINNALESEYNF